MGNESSVESFLAQFEEPKQNIEKWPEWMRNNARVSSASLPRSVARVRTQTCAYCGLLFESNLLDQDCPRYYQHDFS